jgi:TPR repeat protein
MHLGELYYGRGADQNYVKTREWYEKAAAGGNDYAMYALGLLYEYGLGVP